jgi:hypothetical protein
MVWRTFVLPVTAAFRPLAAAVALRSSGVVTFRSSGADGFLLSASCTHTGNSVPAPISIVITISSSSIIILGHHHHDPHSFVVIKLLASVVLEAEAP